MVTFVFINYRDPKTTRQDNKFANPLVDIATQVGLEFSLPC